MEIRKNVELLRNHIMLKYGIDKLNTADNYGRALYRFLIYFKDYPEPKSISDEKIIEYLLTIPGRSNRCTHHSAIKKFYYLKNQPHKFKYIPYPEKEDRLPIHVSKEEFMKMISVCKNNKHRALICLMFDAGLRVSEVVNLKIEHIDESNMILNVVQGKGRKDRRVKFTKVLLAVIRDYRLEYKPTIYLFNGQGDAAQYSVKSCQEVVKQLAKKAGIEKHFTPHKFRHGFAMTLLENGEDLSRIQDQMGHHSEKTTRIYARMNNKVIQDIESPLEQIVRENSAMQKKKFLAATNDTRHKSIGLTSAYKIHNVKFGEKNISLSERNGKIVDATEGAKWAIGIFSYKALEWFQRKGATIMTS